MRYPRVWYGPRNAARVTQDLTLPGQSKHLSLHSAGPGAVTPAGAGFMIISNRSSGLCLRNSAAAASIHSGG